MTVVRRRLLPALSLAAVLVGCSTVPSESPTVEIPQGAGATQVDVGIEALGPQAGASPEDVVRGFLDAAASPTRGHPVARQFLTPDQSQEWSDTTGTTVIRSDYAAVQTAAGEVELTADLIGVVDRRGSFTVGTGQQLRHDFTLAQVDGEWRISDPPEGLVILEPDFSRTYSQLDAFYLDPTGGRLVPDPLYLVDGTAQPTSLVEQLIAGPAPGLAPGVTNALAGASLKSTVSISGQTATVDLMGVDASAVGTLTGLSQQLVWSLDQLGTPVVRSVRVLLDGEPVQLPGVPEEQTVDDWAALDPDAAPVDSVGHYVVAGALHTVDGAPVPGAAGSGVYGLVSAAVYADTRTGALSTAVGVTGGPAPTLLAGPYGGDLLPVLTGGSLTPPTVSATRQEVWTVRDGTEVIRLPSGGGAQVVDADPLPAQARMTQFQLSPDGVRAAVVVQTPAGTELQVGTIVRTDGAVALRNLREVSPGLRQVAGVAWRNASTLVVLAAGEADDRTVPYTVGVDGWDLATVSTAGLPSAPTEVAAAPSRPPLVTAGGTVWRLANGRWLALLSDGVPLPGQAPFYPF